jgi:signal transduction histidine kinase
MSTTTDTTTPGADMSGPADGAGGSKDPYIRGTDETVLLDLRELRAQEAADQAARAAAADPSAARAAEIAGANATGANGATGATAATGAIEAIGATGAELEHYHGSHRRDAVLYADGGTAIPLDRVREVCHDLRQPVAAILMLASAAELRPDVPERVRDVLQEIMSQTEEISATVRQFLDDAKQGVDGLGDPVPCNVAGLAAESVERWRATFDGDLDLAAAEDPLHVTVDPVLFKRALGNVLSNGTRAAGDSGRVQVTVRRFETAEGERAVIEVDDSGPGFGNIPAGHGLGLAVVRRTIDAAGGSVEFAEGPLGGALVRLVLPVTPIRPLSADDELTKTFHGEISLSQLAAELAAGGVHRALADFDDFDDFDELDDFDDLDEDDFEEVDGLAAAGHAAPAVGYAAPAAGHTVTAADHTAAAEGHTLTGGHAFVTRISAWPEPMAISGTPEQLAIGGPADRGNLFGARAQARAAEQDAIAATPAVTPQAAGDSANRSYFGLPMQQSRPAADDRGFFGVPAARGESSDPAESGYFGLPLKNDTGSQPSAAPQRRVYDAPSEIAAPQPPMPMPQHADIAAHPVPTGLLAERLNAAPQAPAEAAASHPARSAAPGTPQPPAAQLPAAAPATAQAPTAAPAFAAAGPARSGGAPGVPETQVEAAATQTSGTEQAFAAPFPATAAPAFAAPQLPAPAQTPPPTQAPLPLPLPTPTFDPSDTQPLHIIPTGQDDTALASIQLPSQANLTHPPRIPASALQPVASVQLSLLPGGAF